MNPPLVDRRGGRVADSSCLLSNCTLTGTEGSNPSPSANFRPRPYLPVGWMTRKQARPRSKICGPFGTRFEPIFKTRPLRNLNHETRSLIQKKMTEIEAANPAPSPQGVPQGSVTRFAVPGKMPKTHPGSTIPGAFPVTPATSGQASPRASGLPFGHPVKHI